jgi:hypothetical protein
MTILGPIFALLSLAGLAYLFGFIANHLARSKPHQTRALYAGIALGVLLTIPAFVALLTGGAPILPIVSVGVGGVIFAALAYPIALQATKKRPLDQPENEFE